MINKIDVFILEWKSNEFAYHHHDETAAPSETISKIKYEMFYQTNWNQCLLPELEAKRNKANSKAGQKPMARPNICFETNLTNLTFQSHRPSPRPWPKTIG